MRSGLDALARDLVMVQDTGCRWVGLLPDVSVAFDDLEARWRGRFQASFEKYGIRGAILSPESFMLEGRFPTGGPRSKVVAVYAFKAYQTRIYGVLAPLKGVGTFVGMALKTDKKRNKADQGLMARVAQNSRPFWD
jgi:hypothetical protein